MASRPRTADAWPPVQPRSAPNPACGHQTPAPKAALRPHDGGAETRVAQSSEGRRSDFGRRSACQAVPPEEPGSRPIPERDSKAGCRRERILSACYAIPGAVAHVRPCRPRNPRRVRRCEGGRRRWRRRRRGFASRLLRMFRFMTPVPDRGPHGVASLASNRLRMRHQGTVGTRHSCRGDAFLARDSRLPRSVPILCPTDAEAWRTKVGPRTLRRIGQTSDRRPVVPPGPACRSILGMETGAKPQGPGKEAAGWRMGWDSNPRWGLPHAGFQDQSLKPLGHPSGPGVIGGPPGGFKRGAFRRFGVQARGRPECKRCHALDAWDAHRCRGWPRSSPQGAAPCPGPRAGEGRPIVAGPFHRALWAICLPATCDPLAGTPRRPADGGLPGSRARPVHLESARHQGRQVRDDPDKMTLTGDMVAHRTARAGRGGRDEAGEKTRSVRRGQDDPLGMTSAGRHGQRQDDPGTMKRTG